MSLPVSILHTQPGGRTVDLTPIENAVKFSSAAVGGFGSLEVSFAGDVRKQLGYLGMTRVFYGESLLWEGQLEDPVLSVSGDSVTTSARAFGLQRKLTETSVRRIWSKRDLLIESVVGGRGAAIGNGLAVGDLSLSLGRYLVTDLTKSGLQVAGNNVAVANLAGQGVLITIPAGLTAAYLLGDLVLSGTNTGVAKMSANIASSTDGTTWPAPTNVIYTASATVAYAAAAAANRIQVAFFNNSGGALTPTATDLMQFSNLRVLGSLVEDVAGGFYGGTILRDLIALVPGLTLGVIEDGSDFTIQAIDRAVRDKAASVVSEVTGYYTREWAVWENGRFDWKTRNLDEAQWTIPLTVCDELELDATLDGVARTVYVLYTDAASGLDAEASAASTDQRNPYARQAITKDVLVSPGFPMTSNTSQQLATRLIGDLGARPAISGRCVVTAGAEIKSAVGPAMPAAMIRGGDNVFLPDLPKADPMTRTGRDSETIFHVVSSVVDLNAGTVTLELEGQQSRADVLLGRLAAVTRTLTG